MDYGSYNYGEAEATQGGGELIPDGTLAWAIVKLRPHNLDQGMVVVPSKSSDGAYLDVELTVLEGPYARRKIWDKIGVKGSEKWVENGRARIRHIIEVGNEMSEFPANHPNYRLGTKSHTTGEMVFMELDELRCAIKIGVEKGKDGFEDKNSVRQYLSPRPASDTHKTFLKLVAGETKPAGEAALGAARVFEKKPAWGGGAGAAAPSRPAAAAGRPSWAGSAPAGTKSDEVPY
jgi:hypothetical protein